MSKWLNSFVVNPNLHPSQSTQVFVRQLKRGVIICCFCLFAFVRAQTDLKSQGQLHLIACLAQTLDGVRDLRRILDRRVDGRAYLLHDLFGFVVNLQNISQALKATRDCD